MLPQNHMLKSFSTPMRWLQDVVPWEVIRIRWGHVGEVLMNRISALISVIESLCPLSTPPYEDTVSWQCAHGKRLLIAEFYAGTLISDFQIPDTWEINSCCSQATQSMPVYYSSLKRLRHQPERMIWHDWCRCSTELIQRRIFWKYPHSLDGICAYLYFPV